LLADCQGRRLFVPEARRGDGKRFIKTANGVQDGSAFVKQIELLRLFYGYRQPTKAEDLYNGSTVFAARNQSDQSWRMDGYDRCQSP
jgi:hypothetical protein